MFWEKGFENTCTYVVLFLRDTKNRVQLPRELKCPTPLNSYCNRATRMTGYLPTIFRPARNDRVVHNSRMPFF